MKTKELSRFLFLAGQATGGFIRNLNDTVRRKMKLSISLFIVVAALCGCESPASQVLAWRSSDIVGHTFDLKSDALVGYYLFTKEGSVSATFGDKRGATSAPILRWRIEEGKLTMSDDHCTLFVLTLVKKTEGEITVRTFSGQLWVFKDTKPDRE